MSTPASAMARTARGFMPWGSTPAEWASIRSALSCFAHPSAIWLRQELPVQRNSTFGLGWFVAMGVALSRGPAWKGRPPGSLGQPAGGHVAGRLLDDALPGGRDEGRVGHRVGPEDGLLVEPADVLGA